MFFLVKWSEAKNKSNIRKQGISFQEVQEVFNNPNAIEFYDEAHSKAGEDRYVVIGVTNKCVILNVFYTDRFGNIRIVTARRATLQEKEVYYERLRRIYHSM
ncbi:MAG: BrnT family toxin [Treponema sp.]|nr:BrnT family toxin [Treponema sp.]